MIYNFPFRLIQFKLETALSKSVACRAAEKRKGCKS